MPGGVTAPLIKVLAELRPGDKVSLDSLITSTGLRKGQVQTGMYRLVEHGKYPLKVVSRGHVWEILPPAEGTAEPDGFLRFKVIRALGTHLVLEDPDGHLYAAEKIGEASA